MSKRNLALRTLTAALALTLLSACGNSGGGSPDGPPSVTFASVTTSPIATFLSAQGLGSFEEAGVDVEVQTVDSVSVATEAALGGNAEVAHSAPTTALQAIAQGAPLKIISGFEYTFTDKEGHAWEAGFLAAPADRGIKTFEDLKGKTVAVTAPGTSYDFHLRDRLREAGLDPDTDVTITGVPYPQMLGALDAGEIDAAVLLAVDYERLAAETEVDVIATTSELTGLPLDMTAVITARTDWLEENSEDAVAFLRGLLTARQAMTEDINTNDGARLKEIAQEALEYDDATLEVFYDRRLGYSGKDTEFINMLDVPQPVIETHVQTLENAGAITADQAPAFDDAVDLSYLKTAYEELDMTWDESLTLTP